MRWEYKEFLNFIKTLDRSNGLNLAWFDLLEYCNRNNFNDIVKIKVIWEAVQENCISLWDLGYNEERIAFLEFLFKKHLTDKDIKEYKFRTAKNNLNNNNHKKSRLINENEELIDLNIEIINNDFLTKIQSDNVKGKVVNKNKIQTSILKNIENKQMTNFEENEEKNINHSPLELTDISKDITIKLSGDNNLLDSNFPWFNNSDDNESSLANLFEIFNSKTNEIEKRSKVLKIDDETWLMKTKLRGVKKVKKIPLDFVHSLENWDETKWFIMNVLCKNFKFINPCESAVLVMRESRLSEANVFEDYKDLEKQIIKFATENEIQIIYEPLYFSGLRVDKNYNLVQKNYDEKYFEEEPTWLLLARKYWNAKARWFM